MKRLGRFTCLLLLICMAATLIAGCGGSGTKEADPTTLRIGVTNFADSLEPTENYFGWVVMRYGLGESLAKFDEKMNVQPWLAESWQISADHMSWTFKIRDGVKFSNGKPLDAAAVKASLERAFAKNKRSVTFFKYKEMKADGQTLTILTEKPEPNMPGFLADPLFLIVDVSAEPERNFAKEGPIGTGPYMCKSFVKDKAVMVKNSHYWDGEVPYETVEIPSIDDPNTRAMALQSGEVDMAVNIAAGDISLFNDKEKFHIDRIPSLRTVLARINQKGVLGDQKVRAAFISACDRKVYNEVILKGTFIEGKAPVPPSMDYGFDQLTDPNSYNIDRAKQLLAEAGWKDADGDGILEKDGKKLTVDFVVYNSRAELPIYAEAAQSDAKKVGFDVKIKTVDYNLIDKMGINGEYDLLISNITTANTGDPEIFLNWYWRTNKNGDNPQNGSGYSNPALDAKFAELSAEFEHQKRRQLIIDIQQIIMNDGAALFLGYPETNIISSVSLEGARMYPSDYYWLTNKIKPAKK
ncbi:ABC transporter substrate-binding protein [Sporomusa termitida]|uniref:Nickel-binding periplasmic protein n=1 Tax=Sporomusa termitida TaxID=2377 RepID=A0A517DYY2_9FIRM|nr:ABC transporter substrate-binding protein [Sporomusa termitida]QDR82570.1 Nickel-binding periplasmic protein [Sporomusa termitida]